MSILGYGQNVFNSYLKKLFFNVKIEGAPNKILNDLRYVNSLNEDPMVRSWALSYSSLLNTKEETVKKTYNFKFTESPIENLKIDFGTIKVDILESKTKIKLHNCSWIISFITKRNAALYLDQLIKIFIPLSSKYSLMTGEYFPSARVAKFCPVKKSKNFLNGITFILSKSILNKNYEIELMRFTDLED